jgi:osmoprotectant transport system permease protein
MNDSSRSNRIAGSGANRIALLGGLIGFLSALTLSFLTLKPNRLAAGQGIRMFEIGPLFWVLVLLGVLVLVASFSRPRIRGIVLLALGSVWLVLQVVLIGVGATTLLAGAGNIARVSVGSAGWLGLLASVIVLFAAQRDLQQSAPDASRNMLSGTVLIAPVVSILIVGFGGVNSLSVMREYAANAGTFNARVFEHVSLAGAALVIASLIGFPLGVWASRSARVGGIVLGVSSAMQTIPSIALLTILIAPFSALSRAFPALESIGIRGIGAAPALTALTLYGLLPIVRGTVNGLRSVPPTALEAGRGMGMTSSQRFWRVELPLALPLVLSGLRTGAVSLVGLTALSSLVGAGGLGAFIFAGLGGAALDQVLLGAIPVLALAVLTDTVFGALERLVVPRGLREIQTSASRPDPRLETA